MKVEIHIEPCRPSSPTPGTTKPTREQPWTPTSPSSIKEAPMPDEQRPTEPRGGAGLYDVDPDQDVPADAVPVTGDVPALPDELVEL